MEAYENFDRLLAEQLLPLREAAKELGISRHRLYMLTHEGRKSLSGRQVKLEKCKTEGGFQTSMKAVQRFRRRLNDEGWNGIT